jgi:hypothetical protein
MNRQVVSLVFLSVLAVAIQATGFGAAGAGQSKQKQDPPAGEQKAKTASLTGCIDQQEGGYVLIDSRRMSVIAALEADGFPTEGFAKHMGHRVTVRGTSKPDGAVTHFKVRSIEPISDICAP